MKFHLQVKGQHNKTVEYTEEFNGMDQNLIAFSSLFIGNYFIVYGHYHTIAMYRVSRS